MSSRIALNIVFFLFLAISCTNKTKVSQDLLTAYSQMEDTPELALQTLESIDINQLTTRKLKAKYAMLYTMALDRNLVFLTNDSIINPALKYYKRHGTNEEKLLTYHYSGNIAMNTGDNEKAMKAYVKAEQYIPNTANKKAIARLYNAKMLVYQRIYDYKAAISQGKEAAKWFLAANDSTRYFNIANDMVILNMMSEDDSETDHWLNVMLAGYKSLTSEQKCRYHAIVLNRATRNNSDNIGKLLDSYLSNVTEEALVNWIYVAEAYRKTNDYQSALDAIDSYLKFGGKKDAAYHVILAMIYESMNDSSNALKHYKEYINETDTDDMQIFSSDTKFIEERYQAEIKSITHRLYIIIISLCLVAITLLVIILIQRIKRIKHERNLEREETERMFTSLKGEIEKLKKIKKDKSIDKEILESVEQRIKVLNMFILAELSDSFHVIAHKELEKLMENREEFMESTKKTFMISHPKFMEYLHKQSLTEWEIGCCCLYCIGFNGAEISEYLNRKAIYNVNGTIRQKLNIPKGKTQIDIYLKQKMQELHS